MNSATTISEVGEKGTECLPLTTRVGQPRTWRPSFGGHHLFHDLEEDGLHCSVCKHRQRYEPGTTRAGAQACQFSRSIQKALHSFVASATRRPVKSLGAMRLCRLEHTLSSESSLSRTCDCSPPFWRKGGGLVTFLATPFAI